MCRESNLGIVLPERSANQGEGEGERQGTPTLDVWPRRYQVGPWSRGREVGGAVQRSSAKTRKEKKKLFYFVAIRKGSRSFVVCFLHIKRSNIHSPGRRPPHITGGGKNKLIRSDIMTQLLVLSIDVCRGHRILLFSNKTLHWKFLRPILPQHPPNNCFFREVFAVWKNFWRIVLIASGIEILRPASLELFFFTATSRFHYYSIGQRVVWIPLWFFTLVAAGLEWEHYYKVYRIYTRYLVYSNKLIGWALWIQRRWEWGAWEMLQTGQAQHLL